MLIILSGTHFGIVGGNHYEKITAFLLALIILANILPVNGFAARTNTTEHDDLIALACEIFPEFASDILYAENAQTNPNTRSALQNEVIFSETRAISDSENLSISLLSSGNYVIVDNESSSFDIYKENVSTSEIVNIGISGRTSFRITCTGISNDFVLSNVGFVIYYSGDDYFFDYGTVSTSLPHSRESRNNTDISYTITFSSAPFIGVDFSVFFRNNQVVGHIL